MTKIITNFHKLMKSGRIHKVANMIQPRVRKKIPSHAITKVHKDKTKVIPRKNKHDRDYE